MSNNELNIASYSIECPDVNCKNIAALQHILIESFLEISNYSSSPSAYINSKNYHQYN